MAPSLINTVAVAAAFAAGASATKSYKIADKFNAANFYDKWDFVTADPNVGYSIYQDKQGAQAGNLVQINKDDFYLGADHTTPMDGDWHNYHGRNSVRVESRESYNHGLFIGDFSHLPKPTCGTWPAFWMFGSKGEFDFLENWNDLPFNRITAHTGDPSHSCTIKQTDMTAEIDTKNCADHASNQYDYQACSAHSYDGVFGSDTGGLLLTFDEDATEWTSEYIRQWTWKTAPVDVLAGKPDPSTWGKPMFQVSDCNIDQAFSDLHFVLNINFCSVAAQGDKWNSTCQASTHHDTCMEHVAANAGAFKDSYFKVKGISVFKLTEDAVSTTSAIPSSAVPSSAVPSSAVPSSASPSSASPSSASPSSASLSSASPSTSDSSSATGTTSVLASASASASVSAAASASVSNFPPVSAITEPSAAVSTASVTPAGNAQQSTSALTTASAPSAPFPYNPYKNGTISQPQLSLTPTALPTTSGSASSGSGSSGSGSSGAGSNHSEQPMTTSTVFTTKISTITSCAPSVTNCPARVTTETIALYTTVCPVAGETHVPKPTTSAPAFLTQTQYVTKTYTITSCAPTVTDCPARIGKVTTEIGTTTKLIPVVKTDAYAVVGPSVENTKTNVYSVVGPSGVADTPASTTITQKVTNVYTITSCAPTVTDCPARIGSVTTEVRTKTNVYPVANPSGDAASDSDKTTTVLSTVRKTATATVHLSLASASAASQQASSDAAETVVYVTANVVPVGPSASTAPMAPLLFNGTNAVVKNVGSVDGTPAGEAVPVSGGVRNGATGAALVFFGALVALF
ncbi:endo-1-3(4)-beta-glucanase [Apiospora sp. TS-2023a]